MPGSPVSSTSPRVVTIILNYRSAEDTVSAVRALRRSTVLDQHVIIADNARPGEQPVSLAALDEGIELLATGGNLGYAGGNNVALRRAHELRPAFFWLLNPDAEVAPDTLELLLATADAAPEAGILGPRILFPGGARIWSDGGVVDAATFGNTSHLNSGRPRRSYESEGFHDVDYVSGAALLIRRQTLERVGLLPEQYFLYFEETAYCRAVRAAGWRTVVDPRAVVTHHKRSSFRLPTRHYLYYMTRNRLHFARDHFAADPDEALPHWQGTFLDGWRTEVGRHAPSWLPTFDALVECAVTDAREGRYGPREDLEAFPDPLDFATSSPEATR